MKRSAAALVGVAALGLGGWWTMARLGAFAPVLGVSNLSGAALRNVEVCVTGEGCAKRAELPPGASWDAGLRATRDGAASLTFAGMRTMDASGYITPGLHLEFRVFGPDRVEVEPR